MSASESILTVVNAHFGTHGKKLTYISRNWYTLIDKFKWVKFYSTEGLHTELLVRKNSKCQHYYIPVSSAVDALSESPSIFVMHLRKVMTHLSSNGCLSLQYTIPFPVLRGYPKSSIVHAI